MIIYMDESGDLGFDFARGKTNTYFVITLLVCRSDIAATSIKRAIKKTRKHKVHSHICELKGSNTTYVVRNYFYRHIKDAVDWDLFSIVVDKRFISKQFQFCYLDKHDFYDELVVGLLDEIDFSSVVQNVLFIVDRSKKQSLIEKFNKRVLETLKRKLPTRKQLYILHRASHEDYGLQAVDLFCWGISRKYNLGDIEWYKEFSTRIVREKFYCPIKKTAPSL